MIAHVALLVRDYDEAIRWFTGKLGFRLQEDTPLGPGKRWVLVAPPGDGGASLLLARAATEEQSRLVGNQGGGRVFLFLHTDDFRRDYEAMLAGGVHFVENPREEAYGTVVVFQDLYGNKWDLVGRKDPRGRPQTAGGNGLQHPTRRRYPCSWLKAAALMFHPRTCRGSRSRS